MLSRNSRFSPYSNASKVSALVIVYFKNGVCRSFFISYYLCTKWKWFVQFIPEVKIINKDFLLNEEIRDKELRVINSDGSPLGVISRIEAMRLSEEKEMDLVMISPNAAPPVCKIMDYGKFIYEQSKKDKDAKKKQKVVSLKEIRLSPTIEEHDIDIKANNARKFLLEEDKVKVTVRFRGREADYSFIGAKIMRSFMAKIEDICIVEKPARLEGKNMIMIVAPKKA